jgi:hypothetical protein
MKVKRIKCTIQVTYLITNRAADFEEMRNSIKNILLKEINIQPMI